MMLCCDKCPYPLLVLCLRVYIKHDKNTTIKIQYSFNRLSPAVHRSSTLLLEIQHLLCLI